MASLDISQLEVLNRDGELFNNTPYTNNQQQDAFHGIGCHENRNSLWRQVSGAGGSILTRALGNVQGVRASSQALSTEGCGRAQTGASRHDTVCDEQRGHGDPLLILFTKNFTTGDKRPTKLCYKSCRTSTYVTLRTIYSINMSRQEEQQNGRCTKAIVLVGLPCVLVLVGFPGPVAQGPLRFRAS